MGLFCFVFAFAFLQRKEFIENEGLIILDLV